MPSTLALKTRGQELTAALTDIMADDKLTGAERGEKLKKVEADLATHEIDVKNSERASEMRAKLGDNPGGSVEETTEQIKEAFGGSFAAELLRHPGYAEAVKGIGGVKGLNARGQFRQAFEIGRKGMVDGEALALKDSTAAANLMGEGLYGATGPTALGQNPYLTGAAGAGILPHQVPGIVDQRFFPLSIESLFSSSPTESPAISYLVESLFVNNAEVTPEAGQYPYSSDEWARAYEQVGKVTNAIKITDETLQDADQFASFAQGRLVLGVQRKKEVALLAGAGAPGVNGLLNRSAGFTKSGATAVQATNVVFPPAGTPGSASATTTLAQLTYGRQVFGTGTGGTGAAPDSATSAEGIFSAVTDVLFNAFVVPDTILINPVDWQLIRLGKDKQGQYYGGSFFGTNYGQAANAGAMSMNETLWGKRVVVTPAIPQGSVLVGSFAADVANIFRRAGLSVEMSNSNGNDFDHGLVTVRAEERLALAVYRPAAFELIQLVPHAAS